MKDLDVMGSSEGCHALRQYDDGSAPRPPGDVCVPAERLACRLGGAELLQLLERLAPEPGASSAALRRAIQRRRRCGASPLARVNGVRDVGRSCRRTTERAHAKLPPLKRPSPSMPVSTLPPVASRSVGTTRWQAAGTISPCRRMLSRTTGPASSPRARRPDGSDPEAASDPARASANELRRSQGSPGTLA